VISSGPRAGVVSAQRRIGTPWAKKPVNDGRDSLIQAEGVLLEGEKTKRYPLGLIHVGTVLREKGFRVKLIDTETCPDWRGEIKACLKSGPLCVGLSVMTGILCGGH